MLLDTQILSFAQKGEWPIEEDYIPPPSPKGVCIPSTVAQEFLEMQVEDHTEARYYIPLTEDPVEIDGLLEYSRKEDKIFEKHVTDRFLVNTLGNCRSQMEFGHIAISDAINNNLYKLFKASIQALEKERVKRIKKRFLFLVDTGIECMPMNEGISKEGKKLLQEFLSENDPKSNFRNTFNDIMILAMSEELNHRLWTEDNLLANFAESNLGRNVKHEGGLFDILNSGNESETKKDDSDDKGYVNTRIRQIMNQGRGEG